MKRITLINGLISDDTGFENNLEAMIGRLNDDVCVERFKIRDMDIHYCCGCWNCWVKTPGECTFKDDMSEILKSMVHSDLTVYISPVVMGFVSSQIKKVTERVIPLVHPYIEIVKGECHHAHRYPSYPKIGLVLVGKDIEKQRDLDIIPDIYRRTALNLRTEFAFSVLSDGSAEGIENEIRRI